MSAPLKTTMTAPLMPTASIRQAHTSVPAGMVSRISLICQEENVLVNIVLLLTFVGKLIKDVSFVNCQYISPLTSSIKEFTNYLNEVIEFPIIR